MQFIMHWELFMKMIKNDRKLIFIPDIEEELLKIFNLPTGKYCGFMI